MKKLMVILFLAMFSMVATSSVAMADVKKGQKLFKKKFRKKCKFSGVKFARHHTMDEWEELWENGEFPDEAKKICPRLNLDKIKDEWWEDIYDFSYKYASDGVIPKC